MALVAVCRRCEHRRVLYTANFIARFGEGLPAMNLRQHLRCTGCRGRIANLHVSFALALPYPLRAPSPSLCKSGLPAALETALGLSSTSQDYEHRETRDGSLAFANSMPRLRLASTHARHLLVCGANLA